MFIHERCIGCKHLTGTPCTMYDDPGAQHSRIKGCAGRTHDKGISVENRRFMTAKGFVDPLKASKRKAGGK